MSTILKALRRLEREKSSLEARPLQDEVAAVAPIPSRRGNPLVFVMAATAALGLGLGASLLWLWPREEAAPVVAAAPSVPPRAEVAKEVPAEAPAPPVLESPAPEAPVASAPPPAAFSSPVAVVERPAPPPVAEPEPEIPGEGTAVVEVPAASAPKPPVRGELPPFDARNRAAQKPPAPAPVARPVEVARAEPPAAVARSVDLADSKPPVVAAKSTAPPPPQPVRRKPAPEKLVRTNLPDVFVSSTVWHPQKDRRLARVTLAGGAAQELHEGDAIGPLVVSVIEPSGVVFLHDGVELRRRVGAKN